MPVYAHIFDSKRQLAPYGARLAMCRLAFEDNADVNVGGKVRVIEVERELGEQLDKNSSTRIGTIDVVEHLVARHPEADFDLLLGADTYRDLCAGKWKRGSDLALLVRFVVVPRPGQPAIDTESPAGYRTLCEPIPALADVSSTAFRAASVADLDHWGKDRIDPTVLEYIKHNHLYMFQS